MSTSVNIISEHACFGGQVSFHSHHSETCNCEMHFAVYQPPQAKSKPVPVLYFLSGLTSTEENFIMKAGAQRYAAEQGLMLVMPDTSPRDTGIQGENDEWDLGTGAGFYVDATMAPWASHYQMYSYVVRELPAIIAENFPAIPEKQEICGHSMGGHGALVCALRTQNNISHFPLSPRSRHRCAVIWDRRYLPITWVPSRKPGGFTMPAN